MIVVPRLRRLEAGLPPRRTGFNLRPAHVGFVADKVALGEYLGISLSVTFHQPPHYPKLRTHLTAELVVPIAGLNSVTSSHRLKQQLNT